MQEDGRSWLSLGDDVATVLPCGPADFLRTCLVRLNGDRLRARGANVRLPAAPSTLDVEPLCRSPLGMASRTNAADGQESWAT